MRNSSYSLTPTPLKLYRRCDHVEICVWLGYNPQINFVTFLLFERSHFSDIFTMKMRYLVCATAPTLSCQLFLNFAGVFDPL